MEYKNEVKHFSEEGAGMMRNKKYCHIQLYKDDEEKGFIPQGESGSLYMK